MKKRFTFLAVATASFFTFLPAQAQIPMTDIANIISQGLQYAQQIQTYTRQGLQLQNELRNLQQNPTSMLGSETGGLINQVGQLMSTTNSIGGNMAQIDRNFATLYKNPNSKSMSENFTSWHQTSTSTLEGALKSAGMHRDQFATDTDALTALYNQSQKTGGNVEALQMLAKMNAMQIQQTQKLGDLIATQNIAASTYMSSEAAKSQAKQEASTINFEPTKRSTENTYKNPKF